VKPWTEYPKEERELLILSLLERAQWHAARSLVATGARLDSAAEEHRRAEEMTLAACVVLGHEEGETCDD